MTTDLIERLREYSGNNGFGHIDYADTMRNAADALEAQGREIQNQYRCIESHAAITQKAEAECETLRAELAAIRAQEPVGIADGSFNHNCPVGTQLYTRPIPAQDVSALVAALKDAATSLETISRLAGRTHYVGDDGERVETYMGHHDQVRGYATSRASVARNALSKIGGV